MKREYIAKLVGLRDGKRVILAEYRGPTDGLTDLKVELIRP